MGTLMGLIVNMGWWGAAQVAYGGICDLKVGADWCVRSEFSSPVVTFVLALPRLCNKLICILEHGKLLKSMGLGKREKAEKGKERRCLCTMWDTATFCKLEVWNLAREEEGGWHVSRLGAGDTYRKYGAKSD